MEYERGRNASVTGTVGSDQWIQYYSLDEARLPFMNSLPFDLGGWHRLLYDLARVWGKNVTLAPLRS